MEKALERRRRPRLPLHLHAGIRRRGGSELSEAQTEDMNCDGVSFSSKVPFALGELLEIRLDLDGILGSSHHFGGLVCLGKVVQAESKGLAAPFRYGCEILDYSLERKGPGEEHRLSTKVQAVASR